MRMRARLTAASKLKKNVSQEKETRYITVLLRNAKTEWMSLNADAFNLLASLSHFVHVRQPAYGRYESHLPTFTKGVKSIPCKGGGAKRRRVFCERAA